MSSPGWLALAGLVFCASCATGKDRSAAAVSAVLEARAGAGVPRSHVEGSSPRGVDLADGADEREIVALALWNNPGLRASLADLGLSEADLIAARTPRNPNLSLLDPVGSGLLEGAIAIPIDLLRRPARIDAARDRLERARQSVVQNGLALARDARTGIADLARARDRAALLDEDAKAAAKLVELAEKAQALGRGRGIDTATAHAAAADSEIAAERARNDAAMALIALETLVATPLDIVTVSDIGGRSAADADVLKSAAARRPDIVAADLAVDAARRDLDGVALDVLQPGAIIDLGQEQGEKLKVSAGASVNIPLFDRGQAARARAQAILDRALAERDGLRLLIDQQIDAALGNLETARRTLAMIDEDLLPAAERRLTVAEAALGLGRASLLEVTLARRDLIAARLQRADAVAAYSRAAADLKFGAGSDVVVASSEGSIP